MWAPNAAYDVSVPIGQIGRFAESLRTAVLARWPHAELVNFGHVGDSNLHVSVYLRGATPEDFPEDEISEVLYPKVREFDGSISAEHGIGTHKKPFLCHSRTPEALALMRLLKQALDANHILCPGVSLISIATTTNSTGIPTMMYREAICVAPDVDENNTVTTSRINASLRPGSVKDLGVHSPRA